MKLYPPPIVNNMINKEREDWLGQQTRPPLAMKVNDAGRLEIDYDVPLPAPDFSGFHIDPMIRLVMLQELMNILAFNGFKSIEQIDGSLKISKEYWSMEIPDILEQMPFADWLPHKIGRAYKHEYGNNLYSSQQAEIAAYNSKVHGSDHLYEYEKGWTMDTPAQHAEKQRQLVEDAISEADKD